MALFRKILELVKDDTGVETAAFFYFFFFLFLKLSAIKDFILNDGVNYFYKIGEFFERLGFGKLSNFFGDFSFDFF
jgi:hypothetical protein